MVLGVNLKGAICCTEAVLPAMRAQRAGKIVILASDEASYLTGAAIDIHGGELII